MKPVPLSLATAALTTLMLFPLGNSSDNATSGSKQITQPESPAKYEKYFWVSPIQLPQSRIVSPYLILNKGC